MAARSNHRSGGRPGDPSVVVDDRERASGLIDALGQAPGARLRVERLEIGDVVLGSRYLIERKECGDFCASIADGRLWRQISAMRATAYESIVIIEGEFTRETTGKMSSAAIRGAILSVALDWRVPVIRSKSVEDTARWIMMISDRTGALGSLPDFGAIAPDGSRRPIAVPAAMPRKRKVAPVANDHRQRVEMLARIQGLGERKAEDLIARFGSLAGVLAASGADLRTVPGIGPKLATDIMRLVGGADGIDDARSREK